MNTVLALVAEAMEFSLRARVRESLESDEPDPHRIAEVLLRELSPAEAAAALAATLPAYVRMVARGMRHAAEHSPGAMSSARWDSVAQLQEQGTLTLLRARVFASGAWKFLGDCTRDDVKDLAEQRTREAAELEAAADRFARLRTAMSRRKAAVVSELPTSVLEDIFNA